MPSAISYYLKGLEIGKDLKDKKVLATFNNNLGVLYKNLSDFKRSTLYYRSALNVFVELLKLSKTLFRQIFQNDGVNCGTLMTQ